MKVAEAFLSVLILAGLGGSATGFLRYQDLEARCRTKEGEFKDAAGNASALRSEISRLKRETQGLERAEEAFAKVKHRFLTKETIDPTLTRLVKKAEARGLLVYDRAADIQPDKHRSGLDQVKIWLLLGGSFSQMLDFLRDIERDQAYLRIETMDMQRSTRDPAIGTRLWVRGYLLP